LASSSAFSFPSTPQWPGIHRMVNWKSPRSFRSLAIRLDMHSRRSVRYRFARLPFSLPACIAAWLSVSIDTGYVMFRSVAKSCIARVNPTTSAS
jgi:hypothetical protein